MLLNDALEDYLNEATDSDVKKAKRILKSANYQLNVTQKQTTFKVVVPSESRTKPYTVAIRALRDFLKVDCTCPAHDQYGDCKHAVAAVIYLKNELSEDHTEEDEDEFEDGFNEVEFEQGELIDIGSGLSGQAESVASTLPSSLGRKADGSFEIEMDGINITMLMRLAGNAKDKELKSLANKTGAPFIEKEERVFRFPIVEKKNSVLEVRIQFDGRRRFETTCTCGKKDELLCLHVASAFYYLNWLHGLHYFTKFKTFEEEKNAILKQYGLTLQDPEAAEFKWGTDFYGHLTMVGKPAYMVSASNAGFLAEFKKSLHGKEAVAHIRPAPPRTTLVDYEIGILFNFSSVKHIGFELEPLQISATKTGKPKINKLKLSPTTYSLLRPLPD